MNSLAPAPLFVGGVELLLIGAVALVLIFGSKATDIARKRARPPARSAKPDMKQKRR